jgi:hypothetical protein
MNQVSQFLSFSLLPRRKAVILYSSSYLMRSFQELNPLCLFAMLSLYHLPLNHLSWCREEAKSKRIAVACSTSHLVTIPYFHVAEEVHINAPSQYPEDSTTCSFTHLILHFQVTSPALLPINANALTTTPKNPHNTATTHTYHPPLSSPS